MHALPTSANRAPVHATVNTALARLSAFRSFVQVHAVKLLMTALAFMIVLMPQVKSFASTTITIDTDVLFSSVNDWITVFLPIAAIGLGIAIALAVIAFVGDAVLQGFRRGRS